MLKKRAPVIVATMAFVIATLGATAVASEHLGRDAGSEPANIVEPEDSTVADTYSNVKQLRVAGDAFKADDSSNTWDYAGQGCMLGSGDFSYQIHLPQNATITQMEVLFHDTNSSGNGTLALQSYGNGPQTGSSPGSTTHGFVVTSGSSGYDSNVMSFDPDPVVDNTTRTYMLIWSPQPNVNLCSARLTYTLEDEGDLTFHSIEPCAIFDTRSNGEGKFNDGDVRTYDTTMSDYESQGGVTGNCGLPADTLFDPGNVQAVAINLVAINPDGFGNFKAWSASDDEPDGGVLVFNTAGGNNANELNIGVSPTTFTLSPTFQLVPGGKLNLKAQTTAPVHARGVLVGYWTKTPTNQS